MKVRVTFSDTKFNKEDKGFINKFIKLLQDNYPLKKDITIMFLGDQIGGMSTGSRNQKSELKVLAKGRLNRDIMRTLAHEWVHEYQMSVQKREHGPNIGGRNEDEANAFAGRLVKMFEKDHPNLEHKMYESKGINNKLNLLNEQILLNEKLTIKENLIVEMKKIGIDKLPYSYSSLQKFIDSKTMNIHYNKHYKGYVDKLNKALKDKDGDMELEEIVKSISKFDTTVRNNAGGAFNHALFWKMLSPKKQIPKGEVYKQIKKDFGNIKKMKDEFNKAAKDRFGSGWAWLYLTKDGNLKIMSLPNQDNPLMNVVKKGGFPILGLDVWEHAYYLKYQNKRDEYINNFWNVVNWEFVEELFLSKTKKEKKQIKESVINEIAFRPSKIDILCGKSKIENSPYCRLKDYRDEVLSGEIELVRILENSFSNVSNFFGRYNVGVFPAIIERSLGDGINTVNFLQLLSDYITDEKHKDTKLMKILRNLKKISNQEILPDTLDKILQLVRSAEHAEYERSWGGEHFDLQPTKLTLKYKCGDDQKEKLIDLLKKVKSEETAIDILFEQIIKCLNETFNSPIDPVKQDIVSKRDMVDPDGDVIVPAGKSVEVKKMDPKIDSYLSEFFSIFKQSNLKDLKGEYLEVYNELIQKIFEWLTDDSNESAKNYIQRIRNQLFALGYDDKILVPMEYVDIYWSNRGQRGCDEKRLSIRFRIDPKFNKIKAYKYVGTDTLEPITIPVSPEDRDICI
jgi:Fe-Mn family superoxide dismutase